MKHDRYKDLGIVSAKKPADAYRIIETEAGVLYMVDSADEDVLLKSVDKGDNWTTVYTDNGWTIDAIFYDYTSKLLWIARNDGAGHPKIRYFDTDDSDSATEMDQYTTGDAGTYTIMTIFRTNNKIYAINFEDRAGTETFSIQKIDVDPMVNTDSEAQAGTGNLIRWTTFLPTGADEGFFFAEVDKPDTLAYYFLEGIGAFLDVGAFPVGYTLHTSYIRTAIVKGDATYGTAYIILTKTATGVEYLYSFTTDTYDWTELSPFNILLQAEILSDPNITEKAFSIDAVETVYETKNKGDGIVVLQNISAITDAVIIAITDNFLINDDGDMFEFQDVTNEISTIRYTDGIMGILKRGNFTVHPDFHVNWSKGDSIKIYDDKDVLEFHGLITYKNRNSRGIYVYKIDSFTNEIYQKTYENDYSGDDSDTKQKDIIDNACDFCYRSSSIVGTTTNYDYEYNRAIIYLFWLTRFLERQVPYIESDGKIWTKAHDGLAKNDMIYPGTYNFRDEADGTAGTDIIFCDTIDVSALATIITSHNNHRKVLKLERSGANNILEHYFDTNRTSGEVEFWIETSDSNLVSHLSIREGNDWSIQIYINITNIYYHDGAEHLIQALASDQMYRIRVKWYATNTFDMWIDGSQVLTGASFRVNMTSGVDRFMLSSFGADHITYLDAFGESWDPAYTVGDNETAWNINNHWQEVFLIDIPGLEEKIQGFFSGNSGITRNTVRYKNNATTIRPVAAIRDPIEQLQGILPLNEFRDPKIEETTEVNQLGDNRYDIWSNDIIFLGLRIEDQGYLQPGKTVEIENTGEITIPKNNYLILSFERDPKNDVYNRMILSDNIIFPSEFTKLQDTSNIQIHTASVQAIENQFDINLHLTREGGIAVRLTNKTGANSIKGTLVEADAAVDNAFVVTNASTVECFGVVYEDGIADGSECTVVIGGRCQVLLKDATASTRGNWVKTSDVAGRADATSATPAAAPTHFREIGHCIESKGADTDVLAFIMMHFL